ncbi:HSP90 co-chaperone p23 [Guillardia theta CCMP2712]|uniref:HSP90 co-chaperone p23 n=1 Tax=Guillardia theta (strain CCMP2712) TaxID=905079 RepID=L1IRP1_GUITC|nr:HSP90 co-chaperone p23 [Guillardia theta CCMP2712]EKX38752.1 HSP90 co-chaperone p23 [Guillardia theta CCMP2712]|eukprot:XP_005825732.1 HSP90 co-chaperone p23 [Guillardia theta CCMP2712]
MAGRKDGTRGGAMAGRLVFCMCVTFLCGTIVSNPMQGGEVARLNLRAYRPRAGHSLEGLRLRGGAEGHVPGVAWSQRQNTLLFKVDVPHDAASVVDDLKLSGNKLTWQGELVNLNLELYGSVDENSINKKFDGGRIVTVVATKSTKEWWPRLTSGPKPANVKVDWATWQDDAEDETAKYDSIGKTGEGNFDDDFNFDELNKGKDNSKWAENDDAPEENDDGDADDKEEAKNDGVEIMEDEAEKGKEPPAQKEGDGDMPDA